jgi:DNA mismatch repair protein MutL
MIELLSEHVANQIAAGEVIQRPASAVKELLENAVDAESTKIQLIIKDAGATLVQVIDNGFGMSKNDAELCFKKHATSKIKSTDDLFSISSKGFRGEALSSIAAVAQVELKTKKKSDEIGHQINIEASKIINSESCAYSMGTSISMRNLFYNVPARRNFLKSKGVETKHIIDEFQRIALTHPEIHFTMHHNESLLFDLPISKRRQRIVGVFGNKYKERLVPVEEKTSITTIEGFVLKPEFSKRTRGEQFLFINNRYIKNNSINHAIKVVFKDLIGHDYFPSYFIYLTVPYDSIDVNIHPSKTEIKFEDERAVYELVKSSVRSSLSKNNIAPSIDFNLETSFDVTPLKEGSTVKFPSISVDPNYNPFQKENKLDIKENINLLQNNFKPFDNLPNQDDFSDNSYLFLQLGTRYIITIKKNGLLIIDVFRAHQQIKFEELIERYKNGEVSSQRLLHPIELELSSGDVLICLEIKEDLERLGIEIDQFGKQSIVINTFPGSSSSIDGKSFIESCLENIKNNNDDFEIPYRKIAWNISTSYAHGTQKNMSKKEMAYLIDCLFSCQNSLKNSKGLSIVKETSQEEINKMFN